MWTSIAAHTYEATHALLARKLRHYNCWRFHLSVMLLLPEKKAIADWIGVV